MNNAAGMIFQAAGYKKLKKHDQVRL